MKPVIAQIQPLELWGALEELHLADVVLGEIELEETWRLDCTDLEELVLFEVQYLKELEFFLIIQRLKFLYPISF